MYLTYRSIFCPNIFNLQIPLIADYISARHLLTVFTLQIIVIFMINIQIKKLRHRGVKQHAQWAHSWLSLFL